MGNAQVIRRLDTPLEPFRAFTSAPGFHQRWAWPAMWIAADGAGQGSQVTAYRLRFVCEKPAQFSVHVTADQRYWLYLDGERVGLGSERGCLRKWFYETYEIALSEGPHTFGAITWYLMQKAPWAQVSAQAAFLLAAPDHPFTERVSTGLAPWESRVLSNVSFLDPTQQVGSVIGCGARISHEGPAFADVFSDDESPWSGVRCLVPGNSAFYQCASAKTWVLYPAKLPAMRLSKRAGASVVLVAAQEKPDLPLRFEDTIEVETEQWQAMLDGRGSVRVPENTRRRVLIDLNDYCCGYYRLTTAAGAGADIAVSWAERLSTKPDIPCAPADRRQVEGLYFVGTSDRFRLTGTGAACYEPLWWQAGRWVQLEVATAAAPLTIRGFDVLETGYPLENAAQFESDDKSLDAVAPVCYRTLQCCAHETYMDCPYWEQLQYVGDTRIQALLTYVTSCDTRLPGKALDIFRYSMIGASPLPASNYPSRNIQIIPPFALWWICMLHDYARWRGNRRFVQELLPLAWWIVDHFLLYRRQDGLVTSLPGWNYVDSSAFPGGEPPGALPGETSGLLNWQLVLALNALHDVCVWVADPERAGLADRLATELAAACENAFWDSERGALADDIDHTSFSEHAQSLAILANRLPAATQKLAANALLRDPDLRRAGPYFSHYVYLAMGQIGASNRLIEGLRSWCTFVDAGFKTFPEHRIQGRSDCHAWSAHPLFHMLRSVLGIQPAEFGFASVRIEPMPGPLRKVSGRVPHPRGDIRVKLEAHGAGWTAEVTLPEGLTGHFQWGDQTLTLTEGAQRLDLEDFQQPPES